MIDMRERVLFTLDKENNVKSPAYDQKLYCHEQYISAHERIIGEIRDKLHVQDRQIEILMELVNEQRDTIQLIKYAFED